METQDESKKGLDYYLSTQYQINLTKREEDDEEYWFAEIPDLPGCYSHGSTPDEAVEQLADAKATWIESCLADGYEVPEPFDVRGFSGKLSLRIPKSLHRKISETARTEGVSLNQYILSCLSTGIGADEQLKEVRLANRRIVDSHGQLERLVEMLVQAQTTRASWPPAPWEGFPHVGTASGITYITPIGDAGITIQGVSIPGGAIQLHDSHDTHFVDLADNADLFTHRSLRQGSIR